MRLLLVLCSTIPLVSSHYDTVGPLYHEAMNLLEREIALMQDFVRDVHDAAAPLDGGGLWQSISGVFSDLTSMFDGGGEPDRHVVTVQHRPMPAFINVTELTERARERMLDTKREIIMLNERIAQILHRNFDSENVDGGRARRIRPYGDDYHRDRDAERQEDNRRPSNADQAAFNETQKDEPTTPPDRKLDDVDNGQHHNDRHGDVVTKEQPPPGHIAFELPLRGSVSRALLVRHLYDEELEMVDRLPAREIGEMLKPLILGGAIDAKHGQCRLDRLLNSRQPVQIEP